MVVTEFTLPVQICHFIADLVLENHLVDKAGPCQHELVVSGALGVVLTPVAQRSDLSGGMETQRLVHDSSLYEDLVALDPLPDLNRKSNLEAAFHWSVDIGELIWTSNTEAVKGAESLTVVDGVTTTNAYSAT